MERKVYIKALSRISLRHPDPDYTGMFPVMEARRMSRLMKRALAVSKQALALADVTVPDAIVTGTGLGCIENTEQFLRPLLGLSDAPLRPTHFMQSTHNTISSLIAIKLGCHGYNATYSQGGISFESALLDAFLQLRLGMIDTALVGAFEEMTPDYAAMLEKTGWSGVRTDDGRLSETAAALLLTASPDDALCELADIRLGTEAASTTTSCPAPTATSCPAPTSTSCPAPTGHLTRADYVPLYGDNFCVSALGACDAVERVAAGDCDNLLLENDFHGKSRSSILFRSLCGR